MAQDGTLTKSQKAWRAKWTEALRSGRYRSVPGMLRDSTPGAGGFCCLGVACDVVAPEKWKVRGSEFNEPYKYTEWDDHDTDWPESMMKRFGLNRDDITALMGMNDGSTSGMVTLGKFTFDEIADVIDFMTLAGV